MPHAVDRVAPAEFALLRKRATPRQAQMLDALQLAGTKRGAAKALNVTVRSVERLLVAARKAAASAEPEAHAHSAPAGYHLRGVSTLVNADGETVMQWRKTARDPASPEGVLEAFRDAIEDDPIPAAKPAREVTGCDPDRMVVYPMGDPHLGMLSWAPETGENFDLEIGERNLSRAVDHLVRLAPRTERALVLNLGDMLHADNQAGVTSRSGHSLDVDGRWQKVMRVAIRTMVRIIDRALTKHATVAVECVIGNHDDLSSMMLALALAEHYRLDKRAEVSTSPSAFRYHTFGANLVGATHGNGIKGEQLPGIMAHDVPQEWGATKHRYWYVGHVHHTAVKEHPGCVVESFRTLAARDAWHAAKGYRSGRSMVCDVLHRDFGRVLRHEVGIDLLAAQG